MAECVAVRAAHGACWWGLRACVPCAYVGYVHRGHRRMLWRPIRRSWALPAGRRPMRIRPLRTAASLTCRSVVPDPCTMIRQVLVHPLPLLLTLLRRRVTARTAVKPPVTPVAAAASVRRAGPLRYFSLVPCFLPAPLFLSFFPCFCLLLLPLKFLFQSNLYGTPMLRLLDRAYLAERHLRPPPRSRRT